MTILNMGVLVSVVELLEMSYCLYNLASVFVCVCRLCGMITWMYHDKERSRLMKLPSSRGTHNSLINY